MSPSGFYHRILNWEAAGGSFIALALYNAIYHRDIIIHPSPISSLAHYQISLSRYKSFQNVDPLSNVPTIDVIRAREEEEAATAAEDATSETKKNDNDNVAAPHASDGLTAKVLLDEAKEYLAEKQSDIQVEIAEDFYTIHIPEHSAMRARKCREKTGQKHSSDSKDDKDDEANEKGH